MASQGTFGTFASRISVGPPGKSRSLKSLSLKQKSHIGVCLGYVEGHLIALGEAPRAFRLLT